MNHSRSLATSILGFALMVLVACAALNWAARLLREALPVLVPVAVAGVATYATFKTFWQRDRW